MHYAPIYTVVCLYITTIIIMLLSLLLFRRNDRTMTSRRSSPSPLHAAAATHPSNFHKRTTRLGRRVSRKTTAWQTVMVRSRARSRRRRSSRVRGSDDIIPRWCGVQKYHLQHPNRQKSRRPPNRRVGRFFRLAGNPDALFARKTACTRI